MINYEANIILKKLQIETILNFQSTFSLDYNKEKIEFFIPQKEKAFMLEAKWGAILCFSNLPFEDFFFLFIAIMLEHSVIFFSKNMTLLTSTM
jgi:hypothetical protein